MRHAEATVKTNIPSFSILEDNGVADDTLGALTFRLRQPMVSVGIRLNVSGGHWGLTFPPF
jgi:hypothetical protein